MRIACWIPEATNTHSEYVILTTATMVALTPLDVTFIQILPILSRFYPLSVPGMFLSHTDGFTTKKRSSIPAQVLVAVRAEVSLAHIRYTPKFTKADISIINRRYQIS